MKMTWLGVAIIVLATGTVRAESVCGFPGKAALLKDRIADCKAKNPGGPTSKTTDDKDSKATLTLVVRTESGLRDPKFYEVWQVNDLKKHFPVRGHLLKRNASRVYAVDGVSVDSHEHADWYARGRGDPGRTRPWTGV